MTEQEKFEAYANTQGYPIRKDEQGLYRAVSTFCHWGTWQAAIASREPWQPIETAPKDGQTIVVGYGRQSGFPVKIVRFNTIHKHWEHYGEADIGLKANATHWMPLPPPPKD